MSLFIKISNSAGKISLFNTEKMVLWHLCGFLPISAFFSVWNRLFLNLSKPNSTFDRIWFGYFQASFWAFLSFFVLLQNCDTFTDSILSPDLIDHYYVSFIKSLFIDMGKSFNTIISLYVIEPLARKQNTARKPNIVWLFIGEIARKISGFRLEFSTESSIMKFVSFIIVATFAYAVVINLAFFVKQIFWIICKTVSRFE